jgi:flavorubredoxin
MAVVPIKPDIYWIGVDDRTTDLFEGIWPITKEGVSYNTYLINDTKKAIIDLTKSLKADEFFSNIQKIVDVSKIDYVVINHMEPDHSGVIKALRKMSPGVTILGSKKTKEMLASFYGITENIRVVSDGEEISLGKNRLKFFSTPFVHWPETIMTYETTNRILFSCDGFGSYGALGDSIFDDDCSDISFYEREALRYYVNIVAKFSGPVLKAIAKLKDVQIDIVAPSHGRVWRKCPERIIGLYKKWAGYAVGPSDAGVTVIYGSMYGNTENMMNSVVDGLKMSGVPFEVFDASRIHVSYILPSLWTRRGVMVGAPTYENDLFPPVAQVLKMAEQKQIANKIAAWFGSYGWSGGAEKTFDAAVEQLKWKKINSFEFCGGPTNDDLKKGVEFGKKFGDAVKPAR